MKRGIGRARSHTVFSTQSGFSRRRASPARRLMIAVTVLLTLVGALVAIPPAASAAVSTNGKTQQLVPGPVPKNRPQPKNMPTLQNGFGPTQQQTAAMTAAVATAHTSGKSTVVNGLTTETQQVQAQPNGRFQLTENAVPVRTQQHGTWVPVDTTLHHNANGTYTPTATAYGQVAFSGGGNAPLAITSSGTTTYAVSWPTPLPVPTVSGSTATYPNVFPGVDLALTATVSGGFSDVLIVHNSAAAHNPALATLTLATSVTNGHITPRPANGLQITSTTKGGDTLTASSPMAWDSNTTLAASATGKARTNTAAPPVSADPSDIHHPGLAAHLAPLALRANTAQLALTPDSTLLSDPNIVYPLYLDPTFNWHNPPGVPNPDFDEVKQGAPCTNTSLWDNTGSAGDYGELGVGYNKWSSCIGIQRAYYQWALPSVIWGATIGNVSGQAGAAVDVLKLYSAACISSTDNLLWAGGIGTGTTWNNQPGFSGDVGAIGGPIPNGPNSAHCPNAPQPSAAFDVSNWIQASASSHASQFTVALTGNESYGSDEFSRFDDNPELIINYDLPPNTPGPEWAAAGSDNVGCDTDPSPSSAHPYPYMGKTIETNEPVLNATVTDPDGDHLQATFTYWVNSSAAQTGLSADNLGSGTTAQFTLPSSFVSGLHDNDVVSWRVSATDGLLSGPTAPVCHFIAEPDSPSAPTITSADGLYPSNGTVGATYGTPGRFTVASTGGNVTTLVKGLDQEPPTANYPASNVAPMDGGATISPAARWKLSDNAGAIAADSIGNNHPATLYGGASWATDATRGPVLILDGSTGYANTTAPVLKTEGSFTVSAWVKLGRTTGFQTVVSQDGDINSSFFLQYSAADNRWAFARVSADSQNPPSSWRALSTNAPALNTWTHLVGVYDSTNGAMTLYVDGTANGTATDTSPFQGTGPLAIGRSKYSGASSDFFDGSVSDVQAYQYPLSATDVAEIYQGNTVSAAAHWTFSEGTGTTAADSSGNNHAATLSGGYTWNTGIPSAMYFNGTNGSAATSGPVLDTTGSFTVSAWVQLQTAAPSQWETFVVQEASTASGFYLQRDPTTGHWAFSRAEADIDNPTAVRAESSSPTTAYWTHLVATYDGGSRAMTLYVNGALAGTATDPSPFAANGPIEIGHGFYNGGSNDWANASIADVQLYSTALDSSEVSELYASATFGLTPPSPGPHTLYGYAADAAGNASGYQTYSFTAAGDPASTCTSLAACYDNTGISLDNNTALANFDGAGNSFSATDLGNAGWNPGGKLTIDGGTFTLPSYGSGLADNVLAANQTINAKTDPALSGYHTTTIPTGSALEFLTSATYAYTATPGAIQNDDTAPYVPAGTAVAGTYCFDSTNPTAYCAPHGTITYSNGDKKPYFLTVPDWVSGPATLAALQASHENTPGSQNTTNDPKIYAFSVPLEPGTTIASVTLPDVSSAMTPTTAALHIFSIATRNTTTGAPSNQTWSGSWSSPTEGVFNFSPATPYSNETFREAIKPSLSGGTVRVKIDDALGINWLEIAHATVAVDSTNSSGPTPAATTTPVNLTFGGSQQTTVPEGGMVYSDPLSFPVTANQYLLVSIDLTNQIQWLVTHTHVSNIGYQWNSGAGSADNTMDTSGTPFTTNNSGNASTSMVTDLDVATANTPTQAVLGDGFIDQAQTGKQPPATLNLADDVAATESTTPTPYGLIAEGMESNQVMTDYPESGGSGPALLSRIDRDILDQPGITTVVVDEGLEDVLNGRSANDLTANGYAELLNYLQAAGITVVVVGLSPCDGYTGDGAATNDACTAAVDTQRTTANTWLSDTLTAENWWTPAAFYLNADTAIGVADTSNGETKLNPAADGGDHVNLSNAGYAALANAYLSAQDVWPLTDGANAPTTPVTLASDAASNATNPYLINDTAAGNNPLTLAGTTTWPTDPTHGTVLGLDGTTAYGAAPGRVLNTTGSFSVSAWANLSATSHDADIITQNGSQDSGFALQYDQADNQWAFTMPTSDTANPTYIKALSATTPATGTWTHLVGTYNATTHTLSLYVNATLAGSATDSAPINATGPLTVGRGEANGSPTGYFPGELSTVQAWTYALTPTQITALYQQVN
jgi:hypothetical protein